MMRLSVLILLVWAQIGATATVTLPAQLAVEPGRLVKIPVTTDGKIVRWINGSLQADLIPSESGLWAIFSCNVPGSYLIYAYTAAADVPSDPARCVVVVAAPGPPSPPGPGPGPGPGPADALAAPLAAAYAAETDAMRATLRDSLASVYRTGADVVRTNTTLATWGDVFASLKTLAGLRSVTGKLPAMQKVIQAELQKKLPTTASAPLDAAGRALAAQQFLRIAQLVEGIR